MKVVTYYTPDYQGHAENLARSCREHGLDLSAVALDDLGQWTSNTCQKAWFLQEVYGYTEDDLLWLDADAEVRAPIDSSVWQAAEADVAYFSQDMNRPHLNIRSGTVWFNRTDGAKRLLDEWAARCRSDPTKWDQEHLYHAVRVTEPRVFPLSMRYCQRFDEPGHRPEDAAVLHFQASRKRRNKRGRR